MLRRREGGCLLLGASTPRQAMNEPNESIESVVSVPTEASIIVADCTSNCHGEKDSRRRTDPLSMDEYTDRCKMTPSPKRGSINDRREQDLNLRGKIPMDF